MPNTNPVIVVHGVQGSWLKDEYPVDYQNSILWTGILRKNFGSLHLHPLDATVDAEPIEGVGVRLGWEFAGFFASGGGGTWGDRC